LRLLLTAATLIAFGTVAFVPLAGSRAAGSGKSGKEAHSDIETIVKEAVSNHHIPSLVIAVTQNGKTIFQKAYGMDPLYTFASNSMSNTYALGSGSQVLTGAGIMYLANQGKLSLDDPLSKFLPDAPEAWRAITINQFLTHRSGIPVLSHEEKTFAKAMELAGNQPMRFPPGAARGENSADYDVLGQVIEKASGETYITFMDRAVFKPMKIPATGDFSKLLFRFVTPQEMRIDAPMATSNGINAPGDVAATDLGGRGHDLEGRKRMAGYMSRGLPSYSIPSRGLASNVQDLIRISSAVSDGSFKGFADPDYLAIAPGWKACNTGKDTLLKTGSLANAGFATNLSVIPNRRIVLALMWKIEKGGEQTTLQDESQDILESALGIPVSNWICTNTDEEPDEEQQ
jgi:CubicO group peptidase (beta-lactamase class C family)